MFPKDLRALSHQARELNLHLPLLEGVLPSNNEHVNRAVDLILHTNKKNVGLLGLSFKAGTDDRGIVRTSSSRRSSWERAFAFESGIRMCPLADWLDQIGTSSRTRFRTSERF